MRHWLLPERWSWSEPGDPTRLSDPDDRPDDDAPDPAAERGDGPARGHAPEAGGDKPRVCAYCAQSLEDCPTCGDDWRLRRCGHCSLGLRCPTHHSYWIAR